MKSFFILLALAVVMALSAGSVLSQPKEMPGAQEGHGGMSGGTQGGGMMMCPMMGMGGMGMMGEMSGGTGGDPKMMGRMMEMRGEMMMKMGEVMLKHAKQIQKGQGK